MADSDTFSDSIDATLIFILSFAGKRRRRNTWSSRLAITQPSIDVKILLSAVKTFYLIVEFLFQDKTGI